MMIKRNQLRTLCVVTALVCGAHAFGQNDAKPQATPDAITKSDDVLAGPKVEEKAERRGGNMMGPQGQQRDRRNDELPFQQWMASLRGLQLTQAQQTSIKAIADEFQKAQREHQESLGEDGRVLMRQMREARESGNAPSQELREKLRKNEENRPKPITYQQRIWAELTSEQQQQLKKNLEERKQQMAERRQQRQRDGAMRNPEVSDEPGSEMDRMYEGRQRRANSTSDQPTEMKPPDSAKQGVDQPRRRGAGKGQGKLDERARRRLEFLRSKQSKDARAPGREPTREDRRFEFKDDNEGAPANSEAKSKNPRE